MLALMFGAFGAGSVACVGEDDDDPAAVAAAEAAFDAECNALDDAALKQSTRDARQILLPPSPPKKISKGSLSCSTSS